MLKNCCHKPRFSLVYQRKVEIINTNRKLSFGAETRERKRESRQYKGKLKRTYTLSRAQRAARGKGTQRKPAHITSQTSHSPSERTVGSAHRLSTKNTRVWHIQVVVRNLKGRAEPCFPQRVLRWCARRDLNPHVLRHQNLNLARLPFRHSRISPKRLTYCTCPTQFLRGIIPSEAHCTPFLDVLSAIYFSNEGRHISVHDGHGRLHSFDQRTAHPFISLEFHLVQ